MAILIPCLGDPRLITPANGRSFTLAEMQLCVGGYLELIGWTDGLAAFCNEEGKLYDLPLNIRATHQLRALLHGGDVLVGNVLICTRTEAGEDDPESDLPAAEGER